MVQETLERWFTPEYLAQNPPQVEMIRRQILATPVAGITVTLTAVGPPEGTEAPKATKPPEVAPTKAPPSEPEQTATPEAQPPTPVPVPQYEFRLAGPSSPDSSFPNCCYLFGTVRDAAGEGLEGTRVVAVLLAAIPFHLSG